MHFLFERTQVEPNGVFGRLALDQVPFCVTAEQPWRNNAKGRSCIPAGHYELRPWDSPQFGMVLMFVNPALQVYATEADVPPAQRGIGRALVLMHAANWPHQLQGCIALGKHIATLPPYGMAVTDSQDTLKALRKLWGNRRGHTATVRWACPTPKAAP